MNKTYEMDMCNGPVLKKILIFSIPLMLSGVLQLLFNAADIIVVGRFAGSQSLAAVGSTTALINLLINIFIGLSVGANVVVARAYGGRRDKDVSEAVHTAIAVSIVSGVILIVMGFVFSKLMLELMGTPDDVIDKAVLYMRIYFAGMPVVMLYNFGSAILRAVGDTRRPLYFLTIAGVVNIVLNLFFVIVMNLDVAGVALATVLSQCISAGLVLRCLAKSEGGLKLELSKIKIHRKKNVSDFQNRPSSRNAGSDFLSFQRSDPVFCQLLRIDCHGRKRGLSQYRGLCLQCDERCLPDKSQLYQPEHRREKVHEGEPNPLCLPGNRDGGWNDSGLRSLCHRR